MQGNRKLIPTRRVPCGPGERFCARWQKQLEEQMRPLKDACLENCSICPCRYSKKGRLQAVFFGVSAVHRTSPRVLLRYTSATSVHGISPVCLDDTCV